LSRTGKVLAVVLCVPGVRDVSAKLLELRIDFGDLIINN
jgi:hypothetical protein